MKPVEALVIGGGLAGASLAARLAAAGREVLLVEREREAHHKVCGEFLSAEAAAYLAAIGIDPPALGAVPIDTVRLAGRRTLCEARLPFPAWSLSRRVLDEAVLAQAVKAGATILRGEKAGQLERHGDVWQVRAGDRVLAARSVFLATGKHDVRGWKRGAGWHGGLVGFKMHYRLAPRQGSELARAIELSLFPGGYGGLEPVEEGHANLCFLIQRRVLERHGGDWQAVLRVMGQACPSLARRLQDATPLFARPLAIASIPYGMVRREARDGVWRLGDQAAVIPSFSGDGMSIALHSASLAARCYGEGQSADTYQRQLARQVGGQVWLATAVSRLLASATGRGLAGLALAPEMVKLLAIKTRVQERALTV